MGELSDRLVELVKENGHIGTSALETCPYCKPLVDLANDISELEYRMESLEK